MKPTWAIMSILSMAVALYGFSQREAAVVAQAPSDWEFRGSVIAGYDMYEDMKTGACLVVVERTGCVTKVNEKSCVARRK